MSSPHSPQPGQINDGPNLEPEDEEIERLADEIEAVWEADPGEDAVAVLRRSRAVRIPRSLPYWVAGGIAAIVLAIHPVIYQGGGVVPLVLFVVSGFVLMADAIWISRRERPWVAVGVGVAGLFLMSASPIIRGIDAALTAPGYAPPLAALTDWLFGGQAALWALGVIALYASWLLATRRPPLAFVTIPIFGISVLIVQWVVSLLGTLTRSGRPFDLASSALVADQPGGTYGDPVFFLISRGIEVAGVLLCLRLANRLIEQAAVAEEAAAVQSALRPQTTVGSVSGPQVAGVEHTNTLAILSLIFALVFPLIGVILGHVARAQIRRTGEQGVGLTFAALIIGYVAIGAVLLVLIISAGVALVARGI